GHHHDYAAKRLAVLPSGFLTNFVDENGRLTDRVHGLDLPVPGHEALLGLPERLICKKAEQPEDNDADENLLNIEGLLRSEDHVAKPLPGGDHFGGDDHDEAYTHADADAGIYLWQCSVDCDRPEQLPVRRAKGGRGIDKGAIQSLYARVSVDEDRKGA